MPVEMGIWSLDNFVMKRQFRWLFSIENIVGKPEANSVNVKHSTEITKTNNILQRLIF